MKALLTLASFAAFAGTAYAGPVHPAQDRILHSNIMMQLDGGSTGGADAVTRVYDQWTNPPSSLTAVFTAGGNEIADDLNMLPVGAGWLDNLGMAVGNGNGPAGSLAFTAAGQVQVAFYRQSDGSPILSIGGFSGFTAGVPVLNAGPGGSSRLSFGVGALKSLGWYFDTPNIYASLKILSAPGTGGFTLANAGMQTRTGGVVGTSTDSMFNFGTSSFFNFGGNPVANSAWFIDVDNVPAPSSLALVGLGGLLAARRRRA